jgi:nicotinamidase-related amidase
MSVEQVEGLEPEAARRVIHSIKRIASLACWAVKIDTRLWFESPNESNLALTFPACGVELGVQESPGAQLVPELESAGLQFVAKKHFSSFVDSTLLDILIAAQVEKVVVVGINTEFCIFLTALDAFARGKFETVVVEEATSSIHGENAHFDGLIRLRAHSPEGSVKSLLQAIKLLKA